MLTGVRSRHGLPLLLCVGAIISNLFATEIASGAHPVVAGFERLIASSPDNTAQAGRLLLSDLRCVNCHQPDSLEATPLHEGPRLENLRERIQFDFLVDWLSDTAKTKPGTTMPQLREEKSDATALAHFLFSIEGAKLPEAKAGSIENGRRLYHAVGCCACHAPESGYKLDQEFKAAVAPEIKLRSVPLGKLGSKYTARGLNAFLLDPLKFHPSGQMPRTPLSDVEAADLATYLRRDSAVDSASPQLDTTLTKRGRMLFSEIGCASCHALEGAQSPRFKSLAEVAKKPDNGCLAELPPKSSPQYSLSPAQRASIQAALKEPQNDVASTQQVQQTMLSLNCYACHARDGFGGPEAGRAVFFQTSGAGMDDEGRVPPRLTGVGRKLLPEAIEKVVRGAGAVRPYMTIRMPDFGAQHAAHLSKAFPAVDLIAGIKPTPRDGKEDVVGRSPWGRELIGTKGLSCIVCHDLKGHKSRGIRAIDLASAPNRLRPEWFRDFLIEPAKFAPGTRMPSFWPKGEASLPLINRNTERQIDSIWVYLTELDQNRLPEGLEEKGSFELKPTDAPIVFRTFMKDAGLHAIAVGYPQKVHVAFDAEKMEWALAWRGKFLDAESTWDDRFAALAQPLGTDVARLPFASLLDGTRRFQGYKLDERGAPTFLYQIGGVQVEDMLEPADEGALRRTLRLSGDSKIKSINLLSAPHGKIHEDKANVWSAGKIKLRIVQPDAAQASVVRRESDETLRIGVTLDSNKPSTMVIEVSW